MNGVRWEARISRSGKYHRVEIAGVGPEEEPIALVKDPKLAVAIAALPLLADALRELRRAAAESANEHGCSGDLGARLTDADAALAAEEGR